MKSSILLLLVFFVLGAYVYFVEVRGKIEEAANAEQASMVLALNDDEQITGISIKSDEELITVSKIADKWLLISPVKDASNRATIDEIIQQVTEAKGDIIKTGKIDKALFGFEKPKSLITVLTSEKRKFEFQIGSRVNFENRPYLYDVQKRQLKIVGKEWDKTTEKRSAKFRDNRIYRGEPGDIEAVEVYSKGKMLLGFKLKGAVWNMNDQIKSDPVEIERYVRDLRRPTIQRFMTEKATGSIELSKYELSRPEFELKFSLKGGQSWSAIVSKTVNNGRYIKVSSRQPIYFIVNSQFIKALKKRSIDFWDKKAPFELALETADSVFLEHDSKKMEFTKIKNKWMKAGKPADHVGDFIAGIKNLKVDQFGQQERSDIVKPTSSLLIRGGGKKLLSMEWKNSSRKGMVDVKTSNYEFVVPVSEKSLDDLKIDLLSVVENGKKSKK